MKIDFGSEFHEFLIVLMTGASKHPKNPQWSSGLDSVVENPNVKMMLFAPLSQF